MKLIQFLLRASRNTILASALVGIVCGVANASLITLINDYLSARLGGMEAPTYHPYLAMGLLTIAAAMISEVLLARLSAHMGYRLRLHICTHILAMPLSKLELIGKSRLTAVLTQDVPAICMAIVLLPTLFANLTIILACLVYLGHLSLSVLGSLVVFMVFAFITYFVFERMAYSHVRRARQGMDKMLTWFDALVNGIKELKYTMPAARPLFRICSGKPPASSVTTRSVMARPMPLPGTGSTCSISSSSACCSSSCRTSTR